MCARHLALRGCVRARQMFDHYLEGSGADQYLPAAELLDDDPTVFAQLAQGIRAGLSRGNLCGTQWIQPWNFSSRDWRYTLGGMQFDWALAGGQVEVAFNERYDWHPESLRPTQALHQAAASMQDRGARCFNIIGMQTTLSMQSIERAPLPRFVPHRDRLHC